LGALPRVYTHCAEQFRAHIGKDSVLDASVAAWVSRQECLDLLSWQASLDKQIEELEQADLALVRLINGEQALTILTYFGKPSRPFLTVATLHKINLAIRWLMDKTSEVWAIGV